MNDAIRGMIERRHPADQDDWVRALREVLQQAALAGLWRGRFFGQAAFYGGTALRLFHGLDRFSEDLDFTLLQSNPSWRLADRLESLRAELEAFGFVVTVDAKHEGKIDSAFIKANIGTHLIQIEAPPHASARMPANRLVKVKLETDTDPPPGIRTEVKTLFEPFPVSIRVVTPSCLFAGKLHACLCREWKTRVKGRDWYDLLFFTGRGIPVDTMHLEARLRQTSHWTETRGLEPADVQRLLEVRIATIDWKKAAADVLPFIRDPRALDLWGPDLFSEAAGRLRYERGKPGRD